MGQVSDGSATSSSDDILSGGGALPGNAFERLAHSNEFIEFEEGWM
jgi:hypothetical protein